MAEEKKDKKEMTPYERRLSNLRPFVKGDERAAAGARKGAAKSAATRRRMAEERRNVKRAAEVLNQLMLLTLKKGVAANLDTATDLQSFSKENLTVQQAMLLSLIKKAIEKSDKSCAELILKLSGDLVDKAEVATAITVDGEAYKGLSEEQLVALANMNVGKKKK